MEMKNFFVGQYSSPCVERIDVQIECGFALSDLVEDEVIELS